MDDGSRAAIAVLEAIGKSRNRLLDHGLELKRRTEVRTVEPDCAPMWPRHRLISISLLVDLHAGHGLNWSMELWWNSDSWTVVGSLYWTAPFPYDGWSATWESQRSATDLPSVLAAIAATTDDLLASATTIDFSDPLSWQTRAEPEGP